MSIKQDDNIIHQSFHLLPMNADVRAASQPTASITAEYKTLDDGRRILSINGTLFSPGKEPQYGLDCMTKLFAGHPVFDELYYFAMKYGYGRTNQEISSDEEKRLLKLLDPWSIEKEENT